MAMGSPGINVSLFIQQVRRRPEIWRTDSEDHKDTRKVASAWKYICRQTWPEFDSWPADQKRNKCLALQKKWKDIKDAFLTQYQDQKKQQGTPTQSIPNYDLLTFLVAHDNEHQRQEVDTDRRPAKRLRRDSSGASASGLEEGVDEDRHFLLSLVSYMREVPRGCKLALREDMLRLVRKYSTSATPTDS